MGCSQLISRQRVKCVFAGLLFGFARSVQADSQPVTIDWILDLDGTLVEDARSWDSDAIEAGPDYVRPSRWAAEFLTALDRLSDRHPFLRTKLHIFSAGGYLRTRRIVKGIHLYDGRLLSNVVSSIRSGWSLKRGFKDLTPFQSGNSIPMLIDNDIDFVARGQSRNCLLVDWPNFMNSHRSADVPELIPDNRLARAMGLILRALDGLAAETIAELPQRIHDLQWKKRSDSKKQHVLASFEPAIFQLGIEDFNRLGTPRSCESHVQK